MCGIYFSVLLNKAEDPKNLIRKDVQSYLCRRGPDAENVIYENHLIFNGFVLWQQGDKIQSQPAVNDAIILLYNGDAFNSPNEKMGISDTTWMLNEITKCRNDDELRNFFKVVEGPFSIIFYNKETKDLYFARDSLGRNSLIIERDDSFLRITSTTCVGKNSSSIGVHCMELPSLGIYRINVSSLQLVTIYPWIYPSEQQRKSAEIVASALRLKVLFGDNIGPKWFPIDVNIEKETYDFYEMVNIPYSTNDDLFRKLLEDERLSNDLNTFSQLLENSVKERVTKTKNYCMNCIKSMASECHHSKVGILFSGGIDCTILAVIANKYVDEKDSIDLINVAFEGAISPLSNWNVPDRCSARKSLLDLERICPKRKWNFIEVNIFREELYYSMEHHIKHLIYPLTTVLDESIGCAFWFASRGIGLCNGRLHKSSARVIVVGSGADELFGGYMRHRNAYRRCVGNHKDKQICVLSELQMDWERISLRNLGRDDRVIADNGKTPRAPFIEENIAKFVQSKNASERCCFLLEEGVGDKLFLRLYGYTIGIEHAVGLKKRAIQFGSRIANKNQNANNLSSFFCR